MFLFHACKPWSSCLIDTATTTQYTQYQKHPPPTTIRTHPHVLDDVRGIADAHDIALWGKGRRNLREPRLSVLGKGLGEIDGEVGEGRGHVCEVRGAHVFGEIEARLHDGGQLPHALPHGQQRRRGLGRRGRGGPIGRGGRWQRGGDEGEEPPAIKVALERDEGRRFDIAGGHREDAPEPV